MTVYLSLTMTILISFLFTIIDGAGRCATRMKLEYSMDLALYSIFAEYNRELLEQYELFFIDTTYGEKRPSLTRTEQHLEQYLIGNFEADYAKKTIGAAELLQMEVEQTHITKYALATDEVGALLVRQASSYMKEKYGLNYLSKLKEQLQSVEEKELLTRDITTEREQNQSQIDAVEVPPKSVGDDQWEDVPIDNPADSVHASRNKGVLNLVIDKSTTLSNAAANPEHYISSRKDRNQMAEGYGLLERTGTKTSDILFWNAYLFEKYGCYTNVLSKGKLDYQIEYILAGKNNDIDNLKWVVNRLLLMRETANITYLFSDAIKMAEAEALALSLASVALAPQLAPLIKVSLLFAWAYAESVYDVSTLLKGQKIPLIKNAANWHYSLEGMLNYKDNVGAEEQNTNSIGLSYEDYLRILLITKGKETTVFRAMDIIEMDIRETKGNSYFRIDGCVDYIEAEVYIRGHYAENLSIKRYYYYE